MKSIKQSIFSVLAGQWAIYLLLLTCFCTMLVSQTAIAAEVKQSIYSASVPVGTEGEAIAFKTALQEVFIKVSGNSEIIKQSSIQQALEQASSKVTRHQTIAAPIPVAEDATPTTWIKVDFDPNWVNSRIEQAGMQVFKGSRGPVLVWLMLDHAGTPMVLNENDGTYQEWVLLFKQAAQVRGISVIFPILDLYESTQLDLFQMKAFDQEALKKASTRYHNTHFLAGYLQEDAQGWSSRWALTQAGVVVEWQTAAPTKAELMQTAVTRFADEWMKGARPTVTTAQVDAVTLTVSNVNSIEIYTQIWRGLEKLASANMVEPVALTSNTAVFNIKLQGLAQDFMQGLMTEVWLVPESNTSATTTQLYYRYVP